MSDPDHRDVTHIIRGACRGDAEAQEELYGMLRRALEAKARAALGGGRGRTLQPTVLINDVFVDLVRADADWECRSHFFKSASRKLREIIVDSYRRSRARKRGGGRARRGDSALLVQLDRHQRQPEDLVALDEALSRLEKAHPRKAKVVELRYFAGLELSQVAEVLGIGRSTASLDWKLARAMLLRELQPEP